MGIFKERKSKLSKNDLVTVKKKMDQMTVYEWIDARNTLAGLKEDYKKNQATINLAKLLVVLGFDDIVNVHGETAHEIFSTEKGRIARALTEKDWGWFNILLQEMNKE